jgi:cell division septation protein DedD
MTSRAGRTHGLGRVPFAVLTVAFALCHRPVVAQAPPPLPQAPVEWLRTHPQDPRWPHVCRSFLASSPGTADIALALGTLSSVPVPVDADLALRAAGLLEASGSPEAALLFYTHAAASPGPAERRLNALLNAAALASDLGSADTVLASIDKAVTSATDLRERSDLRALRALLRYDQGTREQAVSELREVLPGLDAAGPLRIQVLFALAAHYHAASDEAAFAAFRKQLLEAYPASPEAAILSTGKPVLLSPAPRRLLRDLAVTPQSQAPAPPAQPSPQSVPPARTPVPPTPASQTAPTPVPPAAAPPPSPASQAAPPQASQSARIQAGSFTVAENASFMAKDLERAGFPAMVDRVVVAGRTYYRVTLSARFTPDDARQTLIRLKQAGFEGALIP